MQVLPACPFKALMIRRCLLLPSTDIFYLLNTGHGLIPFLWIQILILWCKTKLYKRKIWPGHSHFHALCWISADWLWITWPFAFYFTWLLMLVLCVGQINTALGCSDFMHRLRKKCCLVSLSMPAFFNWLKSKQSPLKSNITTKMNNKKLKANQESVKWLSWKM